MTHKTFKYFRIGDYSPKHKCVSIFENLAVCVQSFVFNFFSLKWLLIELSIADFMNLHLLFFNISQT